MKKAKKGVIWAAGIVTLAILAVSDLLIHGPAADASILWMLRLPRIITAIAAGGALALSGAQMQSILGNPLADPHIMGISAGAVLGAAIATMSGWASGLPIASAAFAGALITSMIILTASRRLAGAGTLLIFGVMLGFIANAIVSIIQFSTDAESLKIFYSWSAGSFSTTGWNDIAIILISISAGYSMATYNKKGLDIILFGDEFATMAGADVRRIRLLSIIGCSLMTGAVTAFCGPLGFVGIVAPHIARALFRTSSHSTVLPASLLTGAVTGIGADLIAQIPGSPVPVSSTMAIIGVPVIIYIMVKKSSQV